jgi:hypothetical protein
VRASRRGPLLVALLGFAVFLPSLVPGELLSYDDDYLVSGSRAVREARVGKMLDPWGDRSDLGDEYLPVRDVSYALDALVWGERTADGRELTGTRAARGFRFTNLLIYALACGLACAFLGELTRDPLLALLAGAFFALHPVHAESAAWVSGRKDVLSGALGFGALLVFVRARQNQDTARAVRRHITSVVLGLLAMLSKTTLVALPLLVGAVELFGPALRRERARITGFSQENEDPGPIARRALVVLPHLLVAIAVGWNARALGERTGIARPAPPGGLATIAATDLPILVRYVAASFAPIDLRVSYGRFPLLSLSDPAVLSSALALAAIAGLVLVALARRPKTLAFAAVWFLLALAPVLNVVPFTQLLADRYLFVPLLGPALVAGWTLVRARRSRTAPGLALLLLGGVGVLGVGRGLDFATSERLFRSNIALEPENPVAHHELGRALLARAEASVARGEPELGASLARAAAAEEREAIRRFTRPGVVWAGLLFEAGHSLARALELAGEPDEAVRAERTTLASELAHGADPGKLLRFAERLLVAAKERGRVGLALEAARAFAALGRKTLARDALERARELDRARADAEIADDPTLRTIAGP